ncbi:hypothetical protein OCS_03975 [Ophiocordyceps sinensis CO18]|uniref:Uncharacterized protein n=1 Tax=Ophiocordyceps sinensis (strain Co18 / CGMCC 3.14243) TaxID=911162 RepID=T5ACJ6_OPHSC|nr:hypothetical protein OCS_03975 [Ophiocordyceps sinensis CO18]
MKASSVLAVIFASVAYASVESAQSANQDANIAFAEMTGLDFKELLGEAGPLAEKIGPLIEQGLCAAPCILKAANQVKSCEGGLIKAACGSVGFIAKRSGKCVTKCGIKPRKNLPDDT